MFVFVNGAPRARKDAPEELRRLNWRPVELRQLRTVNPKTRAAVPDAVITLLPMDERESIVAALEKIEANQPHELSRLRAYVGHGEDWVAIVLAFTVDGVNGHVLAYGEAERNLDREVAQAVAEMRQIQAITDEAARTATMAATA